jgi:hypothetical protein
MVPLVAPTRQIRSRMTDLVIIGCRREPVLPAFAGAGPAKGMSFYHKTEELGISFGIGGTLCHDD